jgi:hypothetical protein
MLQRASPNADGYETIDSTITMTRHVRFWRSGNRTGQIEAGMLALRIRLIHQQLRACRMFARKRMAAQPHAEAGRVN